MSVFMFAILFARNLMLKVSVLGVLCHHWLGRVAPDRKKLPVRDLLNLMVPAVTLEKHNILGIENMTVSEIVVN